MKSVKKRCLPSDIGRLVQILRLAVRAMKISRTMKALHSPTTFMAEGNYCQFYIVIIVFNMCAPPTQFSSFVCRRGPIPIK